MLYSMQGLPSFLRFFGAEFVHVSSTYQTFLCKSLKARFAGVNATLKLLHYQKLILCPIHGKQANNSFPSDRYLD